ncbi:hypothetical protein PQI51_03280 [Microbacterium esteraromaticum]|uniref:hypothetical protein n=1 Tax=Microbacterium esteraromaticum TaxID=57043 RepID=UPI00309782B0
MSEQTIRETLATIDEKRARAKLLDQIAEWPFGVPSEVRADKKRGWFASIWKGAGETVMGEIVLTREERSELCDWMRAKATRLTHEADELAKTLGGAA